MMDNRRTVFIGIGAALVFCIMAAVIVVTTVMVRRQSEELAGLAETVKSELAETSSAMAGMKENLILLTQDTSDIRQVLRLPGISYPILETLEEETGDTVESNVVFFQSVDLLLERYLSSENASFFQDFLQSDAVVSLCTTRGLRIDVISELTAYFYKGDERYFVLEFLPGEGRFSLSDITGTTGTTPIPNEITGMLDKQFFQAERHLAKYASNVKALKELSGNSAITAILTKKELTLSRVTEEEEKAYCQFLKKNVPVLSAGVEKETLGFLIGRDTFASYERFIAALEETLVSLDTRTETEKLIDKQKGSLLELKEDGGFKLLLENNGLSIAERFREDSDYFYLDIFHGNGSLIGSFAIQKLLGEVYLTDSEEVPISALKTLGIAPSAGAEKKN